MSHLRLESFTAEALAELRQRAIALIDRPRKRSFFVEFAGLPRAGKSSCIDNVAASLRALGLKVATPAEGASQAPQYIKQRDLVAFNVWTLCYAIKNILEGAFVPSPDTIVFLDRGLFDALCWMDYLKETKQLTEQERDKISDFIRIDNWNEYVDLVFLFTCVPDVAVQRDTQHRVFTKPGVVTTSERLEAIRKRYEAGFECYAEDFQDRVSIVDTTSIDEPKALHATVIKRIVDAMEAESGLGPEES